MGDRMITVGHLSTFLACLILPVFGNSYDLDSLTDSFLREAINRIGPLEDYGLRSYDERSADYLSKVLEARREGILGHEPSIRDKEYLEHSSLSGPIYMTGGAGEGPDGSTEDMPFVKSDSELPEYCSPPNPCPVGYTADDGCLEEFEDTASFSRQYQASQECMCDPEHIFDCPGSTREDEIDALARTFENENLGEIALDRLMKTMENPFLKGEKLPVVAKKAPKTSIK